MKNKMSQNYKMVDVTYLFLQTVMNHVEQREKGNINSKKLNVSKKKRK